MKNSLFKRVLTIAVTAVMALGSIAVGADEAPANTATITIADSSVEDKSIAGNEYTAFQVMQATANDAGSGKVVYTYEVTDAFKGFFGAGKAYQLNADGEIVANGTVIPGDGEWINDATTDAAALASALEKYALENKIAGTVIAAGATSEALPIGFYVVSETKSEAANAVASKPILVNLTENKSITVKDDKIPLEKVIVEDSAEKKTNSVNVGDTVSYKVTTRVPNYSHIENLDADKLEFILSDTMDDSLDYQKDLKVTIDGTEIKTFKSKEETDHGFVVALTAEQVYANQGKDVVLTYSAVLNEKAKVDSTEGNVNDIELKYTNNPNEEDSYGTLNDEVKTFTFGFDIRKVDKNDIYEDLAGAEFEILDADGSKIAIVTYDDKGKPVVVSKDEAVSVTTDEDGRVSVSGLEGSKDGTTYQIHETKAPEGYSLIGNDITVTIKAETNGVDSHGNDVLTGKATFEVGNSTGYEDNGDDKDRENQATELKTDGNGSIDIVVLVKDTKGISLPETGSRSALFCMIGGALIILIGALYYEFAVRRKKA